MSTTSTSAVRVRPMLAADVDVADRVMRLAFGTIRGLPDPEATFGDREMVRTRFATAPECAWVAEIDGGVVGSVFAARWGSFGFFGPLTVLPDLWDRGVGTLLLRPVLDAFVSWGVRQAGLYTFAASPKHLGLYQKHGFWPGNLVVILAKEIDRGERGPYSVASREHVDELLDDARMLTDGVFAGLDLGDEIVAVHAQGLGDTVLVHGGAVLEAMAVCHTGAGSEAGGDACYVKFAAALPGAGARERFSRVLDACEAFAAAEGMRRLELGMNTGRLDAYAHLLDRGFRIEQVGVSMLLRPEEPHFDAPSDYVVADLR